MKVVFAGTPYFASYILKEILDYGYDVPLVLTQPDRPSGRGMKLNQSEVKKLALERNLKLMQPEKINNNKYLIDTLIKIAPDFIVVVAYGLIVPNEILKLPKFCAINVHASILPRWRGASPIQRAIEKGDKKTGVSIIKMDEGLDTGDIFTFEECSILPSYTALDLHNILIKIGSRQCIFVLDNISNITAVKQSLSGITYAHKITKEEAEIIWDKESINIVRKIKAFNPTPGARTLFNKNILKLWDADIINLDLDLNLAPGTILIKDGLLLVSCKRGYYIQLLEVQLAGSKRMLAQDFLKSGRIRSNILLGS